MIAYGIIKADKRLGDPTTTIFLWQLNAASSFYNGSIANF